MTIAIIGSRTYPRMDLVTAYVNALPSNSIIISGGARGVNRTAELAAKARGLETRILPADWAYIGKAARVIRNTLIVAAADAIVAFWDGRSRGTADTIGKARAAGKPVTIIDANGTERPCVS